MKKSNLQTTKISDTKFSTINFFSIYNLKIIWFLLSFCFIHIYSISFILLSSDIFIFLYFFHMLFILFFLLLLLQLFFFILFIHHISALFLIFTTSLFVASLPNAFKFCEMHQNGERKFIYQKKKRFVYNCFFVFCCFVLFVSKFLFFFEFLSFCQQFVLTKKYFCSFVL